MVSHDRAIWLSSDDDLGFGRPSHMKWSPTPPHHLMTQMMKWNFQAASLKHQLHDWFLRPIFDLKVKQREIT